MKESDLFAPIKAFFEARGYEVYAEVKNCDIIAKNENELIIIETKLNFNAKLLYQALDRQKIASKIYIAIPHPKMRKNNLKHITYIAERLEIGLLTVDFTAPKQKVYEILEPLMTNRRNNKKTRAILDEMEGREYDTNIGGVNNQKINTAYKQKVLKIAKILNELGSASAKTLMKEHNCPVNTHQILYRDYYNWFERVERGAYGLSAEGRKEIGG